jgi:hypothetical protein
MPIAMCFTSRFIPKKKERERSGLVDPIGHDGIDVNNIGHCSLDVLLTTCGDSDKDTREVFFPGPRVPCPRSVLNLSRVIGCRCFLKKRRKCFPPLRAPAMGGS